jgi:hypothetical protein
MALYALNLPANPCTAVTFALDVRSLERCIPKTPSNLYYRVSFSSLPKYCISSWSRIVAQPMSLMHCHIYSIYPPKQTLYAPRTDAITLKHGLASGLFGRRTRSFGSGGRGRCVADWMALPCGFGTIVKCAVLSVFG